MHFKLLKTGSVPFKQQNLKQNLTRFCTNIENKN